MQTFNLLNKTIQEAIWNMGWKTFRPIQDQAINIIINTDKDLIISAPTASGKTEAAFLPLISRHFDDLSNTMGILYISPLKALINDQFNRITTLCDKTDIEITKWHGDANYSKKKRLLRNPKGILLITPESIESLLIRHEIKARKLFSNLKCIIIDEIHSFLNDERGVHLYSLINRIMWTTNNKNIRKISLSATIGDLQSVKNWMSEDEENVLEIIDNEIEKNVFGDVIVLQSDNENLQPFRKKIFELTKTGKTLAFSNSKKDLENACDTLRQFTQKNKFPDIYRIHHGSLSKELRTETERELKEERNICAFCTNTLELGIDIGDINRILLLAPPWSVSSFIQRIGRSGRKDNEPIKFAFIFQPTPINEESNYYEKLQIPIIKSIAIIELYLKHFCEPYEFNLNDYSCLIHELLAYLCQKGGCSPKELYNVIVKGSFKEILDVGNFIFLLKYLNNRKYIEQLKNGDLILADKGEKLAESFHFYAVFQTPEQWTVICNNFLIGELAFILFYKEGDQILLAGKRWTIISIEEKNKRIIVQPGKKKKDAIFESGSGIISREIHEKMREIYDEKLIPTYLNETGASLLYDAYDFYDINKKNKNILFLFQGSKITNTLKGILKSKNITWEDFEIGIKLNNTSKDEMIKILKQMSLSVEYFDSIISRPLKSVFPWK